MVYTTSSLTFISNFQLNQKSSPPRPPCFHMDLWYALSAMYNLVYMLVILDILFRIIMHSNIM